MNAPYLYQTVHTLSGTPFRLEAHTFLLDQASRTLFRRPYRPSLQQLTERIAELLVCEKVPADLSAFVRLELAPDGETFLRYGGLSLYRGYELRSLLPEAVVFAYDLPFGDYPTSASEALGALARMQANLCNARCAVRCNTDGMVLTADEAPLFAIRGVAVFTSPAPQSVERTIAAECIAAAGLMLYEQPVMRQQLPHFDELFYFDHRGITSLSRCDGQPYMSIMAERTARAARQLTDQILKR